MNRIRVFVLHVKKGYEDRAAHMERMLGDRNIPFEYVLEGDIPDLDRAWLDRWFCDMMHGFTPAASCASKHLIAYLRMVSENIPYALILEDDIFLKKRFVPVLEKAMNELSASHGVEKPFWIGFEATCMGFTPRSMRRAGRVVYPARFQQCTGAYLINLSCAREILRMAEQEKCALPFDHFTESLRKRGYFDGYWSYPIVAEQGSHMGLMHSSIGNVANGRFMNLRRRLTFAYKEALYFFR